MGSRLKKRGIGLEVEALHRNVLQVHMPLGNRQGSEKWILLRSDAHHDSVSCNRVLEKAHLDEALARKAGVLDFGDLFDAMQGRGDKRSLKRDLRVDYGQTYFDDLVKDAADFYEPYANNILLLGEGNHETKVVEKYETRLTHRLVGALNDRTGAGIMAGGYTNWVRFCIRRSTERVGRVLHADHGRGAGGVGVNIHKMQRQRALFDADFYVSGHTHDAAHVPIVKHGITRNGTPYQRVCHLIKIPTYKDAYGDGHEGWDVEKTEPKPLGAWWLRFHWRGHRHGGVGVDVVFDGP